MSRTKEAGGGAAGKDTSSAAVLDSGEVLTEETTTSTTYTDLTTVGPDATFIAPASGKVVVLHGAWMKSAPCLQSVELVRTSDSTVISAASDNEAAADLTSAANYASSSTLVLFSGLTAGTEYRVRAKYRVTSGTGTFIRRRIAVFAEEA